MIRLLVALVALGDPSVKPWPVGPGLRYTPPAANAAVVSARPVGGLRCGAAGPAFAVHVELFVNQRVVILPAGIGVARPLVRAGATVAPRRCVYPLRSLAPTGVIEVARGRDLTVAELFRVWGQRLGAQRIASFASTTPVRAYVGGKRVAGPVGAIRLFRHAQIVLELGAYVVPHPSFLFPGGSS